MRAVGDVERRVEDDLIDVSSGGLVPAFPVPGYQVPFASTVAGEHPDGSGGVPSRPEQAEDGAPAKRTSVLLAREPGRSSRRAGRRLSWPRPSPCGRRKK